MVVLQLSDEERLARLWAVRQAMVKLRRIRSRLRTAEEFAEVGEVQSIIVLLNSLAEDLARAEPGPAA